MMRDFPIVKCLFAVKAKEVGKRLNGLVAAHRAGALGARLGI